jgi:phage shock protein C
MERLHTQRLFRSRDNVLISGVAGGIAEYFNIDPTLVRLVMFLLLLMASGPFAPIVYAVLAWIIPQRPLE